MKIYFAGSIRGGREDADLYLEIIKHLKNYGEVLTEHVGNKEITASGEDEKEDSLIHNRDMGWLLQSDLIVAEVTTPSIGVGYEVGRAIENKKEIVCLYRIGGKKSLSPMVSGCNEITTKKYKDLEDAKQIIDKVFEQIKSSKN